MHYGLCLLQKSMKVSNMEHSQNCLYGWQKLAIKTLSKLCFHNTLQSEAFGYVKSEYQ